MKIKYSICLLLIVMIVVVILVSGCETIDKKLQNCHKETRYKTVNQKNCDSTSGCECLSKSMLGLGACDSCRCEYQEEVCD